MMASRIGMPLSIITMKIKILSLSIILALFLICLFWNIVSEPQYTNNILNELDSNISPIQSISLVC